jgi:hypothetical protein
MWDAGKVVTRGKFLSYIIYLGKKECLKNNNLISCPKKLKKRAK